LPHLARLFDDVTYAGSVCDAICEIGPAAAPLVNSVIRAIQSDSWDLQWAAADALGHMASGDPHVVAALTTALGHASPTVCSAAVKALAQIGEPALPALLEILELHDNHRAEWAADALGRMGYNAKPAVKLLRSNLRSPNLGLASWSAIALAKIAGDPIAVPTLTSLLGRSDRPDFRQQAAIGLKAIGPPAASAVKALLSVRDDPDAGVRMAVEEALSAVNARRH
jgi:HEAT repeat protein